MAKPINIKADELRPLEHLNDIQHGLQSYYMKLRTSTDIYLKVGAWCALLEIKQIPYTLWEEVLGLCAHVAIRKRAFAFFMANYRVDLAKRAAETPAPGAQSDYEQQLLLAEIAMDGEAGANAEGGIFLSTADLAALTRAATLADKAGGWRASLKWAIRSAALAPFTQGPHPKIFSCLSQASQPDLLIEFANILISRNMHMQTAQIFLARAALLQNDATLCLKRLAPFFDPASKNNAGLSHFSFAIMEMRAIAEEMLGHYKKSYDLHVALNEAERDKTINPEHFVLGIGARKALTIPSGLPAVATIPLVQMLGFPRSGTTLLENVLNSHPKIETFEEISAGQICIDRIERVRVGRAPPEDEWTTYDAARREYYNEIERRRRKPNVSVLVDKMPIRSVDATFNSNLFPEWRYIFSLRHPFDVVLSCFRQRFQPNQAMENFRTFEGSVRLYDITMREWFERFSLDDKNVCYVRYDSLVTDFEATTRRTLDFLGVEWNDDVNNFAAAAEKRAALTPSYQKVRRGLSVGVQTYWRKYDFLFSSKAAEPLHKWAEKFGYPTS